MVPAAAFSLGVGGSSETISEDGSENISEGDDCISENCPPGSRLLLVPSFIISDLKSLL